MFNLAIVHEGLRYLHIIGGFLGLIAFWAPAIARKGSRIHVMSGRFFVVCAYVVGISAFVSSVWGVADPAGFLKTQGVSNEAMERNAVHVRFLFAILGFLASTIIAGVQMGVRVLRTKNTPDLLNSWSVRWSQHLTGASAVLLAVFGIWSLSTGGGGRYMICLILGFIGTIDWRQQLQFLEQPRPTPRAWWYKHMECMIGCGIGFHTAFLVFGISRLVPAAALPGAWALLPWILPTAIGLPLLTFWIRYYKRKFGELEPRVEAPVRA
jgi:hypothetical protein